MRQERPSFREAFHDSPTKKQTLDRHIECVIRCETFSVDYKEDFLWRYEYNLEWEIESMALLGMIYPRRPSKDWENKKGTITIAEAKEWI